MPFLAALFFVFAIAHSSLPLDVCAVPEAHRGALLFYHAARKCISVGTQIRGSAQKLNLVAGLIRGKKAGDAMNILAFSKKGMAVDARKVLASAIANAENNHNLDVDALVVSEASVGKGKVRVPCCLQCAAAVRTGRRPPALVVADADGDLAPYYDTHDVWTRTGYGSLPGNWAKRALLDSLCKAVGR